MREIPSDFSSAETLNGFQAFRRRNFSGNTSVLRGGAVRVLYDTPSLVSRLRWIPGTRVRHFAILGLLSLSAKRLVNGRRELL